MGVGGEIHILKNNFQDSQNYIPIIIFLFYDITKKFHVAIYLSDDMYVTRVLIIICDPKPSSSRCKAGKHEAKAICLLLSHSLLDFCPLKLSSMAVVQLVKLNQEHYKFSI